MDRNRLVLAAMAAGGENATFSPVQVQKLFFLIDREASALTGGPHFSFRPYDYGPFDQQVYWTLDWLAAHGEIVTQSTGRYRLYTLTPEGFRAGMEALKALPSELQSFLPKLAAWVRALNFQQLVSAVYLRYPDMKVNSVFKG